MAPRSSPMSFGTRPVRLVADLVGDSQLQLSVTAACSGLGIAPCNNANQPVIMSARGRDGALGPLHARQRRPGSGWRLDVAPIGAESREAVSFTDPLGRRERSGASSSSRVSPTLGCHQSQSSASGGRCVIGLNPADGAPVQTDSGR